MSRPDLTFGSRVRAERERLGLSLRALGALAEVDPTHVSRVERGLSEPTLDLARRLCVALGMPLVESDRRDD